TPSQQRKAASPRRERGQTRRFHRGPGAGHARIGDAQEPGRPCPLRVMIPVGTRVTKPRTQAGGLPSPGSDGRAQRGRAREGDEARPDGGRESEHRAVAGKRGNSPRGPRGGKAVPEWGSLEGTMGETSGSETISPKLQRVAELAKAMPHGTLTTLAHHMDLDLLLEAYR